MITFWASGSFIWYIYPYLLGLLQGYHGPSISINECVIHISFFQYLKALHIISKQSQTNFTTNVTIMSQRNRSQMGGSLLLPASLFPKPLMLEVGVISFIQTQARFWLSVDLVVLAKSQMQGLHCVCRAITPDPPSIPIPVCLDHAWANDLTFETMDTGLIASGTREGCQICRHLFHSW